MTLFTMCESYLVKYNILIKFSKNNYLEFNFDKYF